MITNLFHELRARLHEGAFWTRAEYHDDGSRVDMHFTVLSCDEKNGCDTRVLMCSGPFAGTIMTLSELESERRALKYHTVSYWFVPDDQIDRVRFT